jgi:hypothetical protein
MGAWVDVGWPPDVPEQDWEIGTPAVCGMVLTQGGQVRTTTWYVRDPTGRLVREVRAEPGRSPDLERRLSYDAAGRLAREERWRGGDASLQLEETSYYERNAAGVTTGIRTEHRTRSYRTDDPATDTWTTTSGTTPWGLDPHGRPVRLTGVRTEIERDAKGRITSIIDVVTTFPVVSTDLDTPLPQPTTRRELRQTVVWAADGRSAVETLAWRRGETIEVRWTFDEQGIPLSNAAFVEPGAPEVATWLRDCTGLPPAPE